MARGTYLPPDDLDAAEMEAKIEKDQCEDIGLGEGIKKRYTTSTTLVIDGIERCKAVGV